jgi:biopolymer transport protein ExbB/TolQ
MPYALLLEPSDVVDPGHVQLDGARILAQMTPVATTLIAILGAMLFIAVFVATLKVLQLTRVVREERAFGRRVAQVTSAAELRAIALTEQIAGARVLLALSERADDGGANADELRGVAQQAITAEERRAARLNSVLQGIAATGPLLGLLGTVWGIIEAFLAMDQHASSAITVVAPAMAGALLTTALGLVAAIPSLLALQYAERRVGELVADLDGAAQTWIGVLLRKPALAAEAPASAASRRSQPQAPPETSSKLALLRPSLGAPSA